MNDFLPRLNKLFLKMNSVCKKTFKIDKCRIVFIDAHPNEFKKIGLAFIKPIIRPDNKNFVCSELTMFTRGEFEEFLSVAKRMAVDEACPWKGIKDDDELLHFFSPDHFVIERAELASHYDIKFEEEEDEEEEEEEEEELEIVSEQNINCDPEDVEWWMKENDDKVGQSKIKIVHLMDALPIDDFVETNDYREKRHIALDSECLKTLFSLGPAILSAYEIPDYDCRCVRYNELGYLTCKPL